MAKRICTECKHCFTKSDPTLMMLGVTSETEKVYQCMRDSERGILDCTSERAGPALVTSREYCDKDAKFWLQRAC